MPSALLGLTLACALGVGTSLPAQNIAGTNQTAVTDFDASTPWGYGYYYYWGWPTSGQFTDGTYAYNYSFTDTNKTVGQMVGAYYFTNTTLVDLMTNSGAGYGTGFGGPMNSGSYGFFDFSTNLEDYVFSFDARVEGLLPGQTTANCEMQAQWQSSGNILQHNFAVTPGSNWTHYSFLLSDATGTGGTPGTVSNWVYLIENFYPLSMNWNMNMHQPDPQFGFDDYNAVFVDNLELVMIVRTGAPPVLPPTVAKTIVDWNMDDKPMWGGWGGYNWSQNSYLPTFTWSPAGAGYGVGGSNAWFLQMDNSALAPPNTPSWAGGGTGDNGPTDFSRFDSGDLKQYQLTFDSRAEGLNPNKTDATTCALQLFLDTPDNNLRLDFPLPAASNWVTTTYTLYKGSQGGGIKASFTTNYNVTGLRIQCQIENSASEADWGYDADNVLVVDNIKIQRIYNACPELSVHLVGANVQVTWPQPSTGSCKLQSANNILGPWADVTPAPSNPHTLPAANAPRFFRTLWVPPAP